MSFLASDNLNITMTETNMKAPQSNCLKAVNMSVIKKMSFPASDHLNISFRKTNVNITQSNCYVGVKVSVLRR